MDPDERHEDFREPTAGEEQAERERRGDLYSELMNPWNGVVTSECEALRRTARAAVEDWLEAREDRECSKCGGCHENCPNCGSTGVA